jgi:hypothetical protein
MTVRQLVLLIAKQHCDGPCKDCIKAARMELERIIRRMKVAGAAPAKEGW